jgi:hypothetical protein
MSEVVLKSARVVAALRLAGGTDVTSALLHYCYVSIIYIFGQYMKLSCLPKIHRNSHINQKKRNKNYPSLSL